jgi:DNA-binding CsgD family transcriptional regulator
MLMTASIRTGGGSVVAMSELRSRRDAPGVSTQSDWLARASLQALEHVGVALIVIDVRGRVKAVNDRGRALLRSDFTMLDGRVTGAGRDTAALRAALAEAVERRSATTVRLRATGDEAEGTSMLVTPLEADDAGEGLAVLISAAAPQPLGDEHLMQAYELTPAEARLLGALVAGERLADYAARVGVGLCTARTHLRGLFAKTGTTRQADLIRRALTDQALRLSVPRAA